MEISYNNYPLISVIIPVYNGEKYLRRCIESVLAQTYLNIEIILVNDGSTDSSQTICDEYASIHPTVKVLKKLNGGLSSARNFGLKSAHGEYVGFIDCDDWITSDMYMHMYELIIDNKADGAQCNLALATSENEILSQPSLDLKILTGRESILEYYLYTSTIRSGGYSVWRCLFRMNMAQKFKFREGKVNEDIDWKYKVLSECNKFVISNKICYYYFQGGDSISSGVLKKRDFDLFDAAEELYKLTLKETNKNIRFYGEVKKARTPFSLLCRIAYYGTNENAGNEKEIIRKLIKMHRKNVLTLLKAPMPLSRKILTILLAVNFSLTKKLVSLVAKK